ncbi:MAG: YDG domain-containing protein, partial [Oscillospiraceae bacterium]
SSVFEAANYSDITWDIPTSGTLALNAKLPTLKGFTAVQNPTLPGKENVTITGLSAVASLTYNGKQQVGYTGTAIVQDSKVPVKDLVYTYTSTDGKGYSDTKAPTNAGAYKLVVSVPVTNPTYSGSVDIPFNIAKAPLTVKSGTVKAKSYDGKSSATVTAITFDGLQNNETLASADYTVGTPTYTDVNVGTNKTVSGTATLTSTAKANNYALTGAYSIINCTINKAPITVQSGTVSAKSYDGKNTANVTALTFDGLQNSEKLVLGTDYSVGTPAYNDINAGANKTVSGTATLTSTAKANNYTLTGAYSIINCTINKAA